MKSIIRTIVLTISLMLFSQQIMALKCGYRLVKEGDRKSKVHRRCGDPDYAEYYQRTFPLNCVDNNYGNNHGYYNEYQYKGNYKGYLPYSARCRTVDVDIWTYDFGRHKFIRELIFYDGILHDINLLEYGG